MRLALSLVALAGPALAQPAVLADFAPVHSLVAQVMAGVGEPALLLPEGEPPHAAALRPSAARALSEADVVIWAGSGMTPWLENTIASLAPDARSLALLDTEGWEALPLREGGLFPSAGVDGETGRGGLDPHAWLDPAVAAAWTRAIADALVEADPANAGAYSANAEAASARLLAQGEDLRARLAPLAGRGFAVSHDALQYFERAAGLSALGTVAAFDGGAPSAAALLGLRGAAERGDLSCLLVEPGTDPALAASMGEGTALRSAAVDPEGLALPPGPNLYGRLVEEMARAFESCLGA